MIKQEIRILGIAFCLSDRTHKSRLHIVGVVYRGSRWLEGAMRTSVPQKTGDLSRAISKMVTTSPHFPQLRALALDELVAESGDYVDIDALSKKTSLAVIAVLRKKLLSKDAPMKAATRQVGLAKVLGNLQSRQWRFAGRRFFVYYAGLGKMDLEELLRVCASDKGFPEASRVARIAAMALGRFFARRAAVAKSRMSRRPASP